MKFSSFAVKALALLAVSNAFFSHTSVKSGGILLAHAQEATETTEAHETVETVPPQDAETYSFEADVNRMLDIVVNSLYQNKEVFLRELISNASDALDKVRYLILTEPEKYKPESNVDLEVKIEYDLDQQTLTIRDTGVGMSKEDLIRNLGTVARSGTTKFLDALKESSNEADAISQIGQFGVGFYSSFLVADRITVASKNPLDPVQHVWESRNGSSDFLVYEDPRGNTMERGTEITLHLKEDAIEYADPDRLREVATHYSEFVQYPISLRTTSTVEVEVEDEDEETDASETTTEEEKKTEDDELEVGAEEDAEAAEEEKPKKTKEVTTFSWDVLNGNPAIWTRDKDEISEEEYQSFWQSLSGTSTNSAQWIHFNAEGNINFKSILYLPEQLPPTFRMGSRELVPGVMRLYVRKVLIGDSFELLPPYLQFIHGVVDSDDLPLNVNRETLQESKILQVIKKKLVRKAIELIRNFAKDSEDDEEKEAEVELDEEGNIIEKEDKEDDDDDEDKISYLDWYKDFGAALKLGVMDDEPNRSKLMKLLRYQTSKSDSELISLEKYVENMKEWQDEIYIFGGVKVEEMETSPLLTPFKEKDLEVLYMTDPIDEYMIQHVKDFNGKKFVAISSENVKFKDEDEDLVKRREKAYKEKFQPLTKWLRKMFTDTVLRVQVSKRALGATPAIVTSSDFGSSANMERILRAQAFQQGVDDFSIRSMKILELNPRHPIVLKLLEGAPPEKKEDEEQEPFEPSQETIDAAWMLHDMAMMNGGFPIKDVVGHSSRVTKFLQSQLGIASLDLEDEIDPPVEEDVPPEVKTDGLNAEDFDMSGLNLDELGIDLDDLDMTG